MDPLSSQRLAAAVLQRAFKDAKGSEGPERVEALAWLASTDATIYMDFLDMPQSTLLTRSGWMDWARETINGLVLHYDDDLEEKYACILLGYKYLHRLKESQHAKESLSL